MHPSLIPVAELLVSIGEPLIVGPMPGGVRAIVPITGGHIAGPSLHGKVLPGGADWAVLRDDGSADVDARYLIELTDGSLVAVHNIGRCLPVPGFDQVYGGLSTPRLECAAPALAWLGTSTLVASFRSDLVRREVRLSLLRVAVSAEPDGP